jgi:hypothetical protein
MIKIDNIPAMIRPPPHSAMRSGKFIPLVRDLTFSKWLESLGGGLEGIKNS